MNWSASLPLKDLPFDAPSLAGIDGGDRNGITCDKVPPGCFACGFITFDGDIESISSVGS